MRKKLLIAAITATLAIASLSIGLTSSSEAMGARKITICHATGSGRWVVITPSASGVYAGHSHHSGDIIPAFAFERGKRSFHYGGKNLGPISVGGPTGQEILDNGCRIPARPATVTTLTTQPSQTQPVPTAVPPTQPATSGPVPTPAPTAVPSTQPAGVPTTAPFGPLTRQSLCLDGEFAHEGSCFPIPSLSVTNVVVPTVTGTDGGTLPVPIVECATREGGQVVTWFGYQLDAPDPLRVERGANNSMSPNGQPPTLFGPGIHLRVISAVSTDGVASWTIGATTVTSNSSTADCDTITDITTTPDTSVPATTDAPDTTQPDTSQPDTSQPDTSQPDTSQPREPGGCAVGERDDGGECISVDPVGLVLVDNYLECDGHGVARFAAFNTNGFALGGAGFSSSMSPQRLTGFAPQVIGDEPIASDDGRDLAEFVDVRYVTAVSWTVVHDGIETTISAGVGGARSNPTCPAARMESSGVHGGAAAPTSIAVTGSDIAGHLGIAILFVLTGALVVLIARRELDDEAVA